jgi:WD40 repeat protein
VFAAMSLSISALTTLILLHGCYFYHAKAARESALQAVSIRRFLPRHVNQRATILLNVHSVVGRDEKISLVAGLYDSTTAILQPFEPRPSAWACICTSRTGDGFLSSDDGDLFWFDMAGDSREPVYFGNEPRGFPKWLDCPDDGAFVLLTGLDMSVWDHRSQKMLWRQVDVKAFASLFVPHSHRLICGFESGDVLEIDPFTGGRVRLVGHYGSSVISLAISPDGGLLAVVNAKGICTVTNVETGCSLWTHRFSSSAGNVQFSSDGQTLLVANGAHHGGISLVGPTSGEITATLGDKSVSVVGLKVGGDGYAYAWNASGTITVWDLATKHIVRQGMPQVDPTPVRSTSFSPSR